MSEPLRAIFSPDNIIFRKECQWKIKILIFCLGYFDKINLSKRDIIFFNWFKDNFFQILDAKSLKTNTCFKRPVKEFKTVC